MKRYWKVAGLGLLILLAIIQGALSDLAVDGWKSVKTNGLDAPFDWWLIASILCLAALFAAVTFGLWRIGGSVLHSTAAITRSDSGQPADAALLILLSTPSFGKESLYTKAIARFKKIDRATADKAAWLNALDPVIRPYARGSKVPFAYWNWQQPLRIIAYEMARATATQPLREIILIMSEDSVDHTGAIVPGSRHDFNAFKAMIDSLFVGWPEGGAPHVRAADGYVQLGDYETSYTVCKRAAEQAQRRHKARTVCLDITGLITETSVAAAIATLNSSVRFSYVNTNSLEPLIYDASVSVLPGGEQ